MSNATRISTDIPIEHFKVESGEVIPDGYTLVDRWSDGTITIRQSVPLTSSQLVAMSKERRATSS